MLMDLPSVMTQKGLSMSFIKTFHGRLLVAKIVIIRENTERGEAKRTAGSVYAHVSERLTASLRKKILHSKLA